jgi:hypothetical protein
MTHGFMLRSPVAHAHDSGEFEEVMDRCLNLSSDHR